MNIRHGHKKTVRVAVNQFTDMIGFITVKFEIVLIATGQFITFITRRKLLSLIEA
jgi:hypothetical protein